MIFNYIEKNVVDSINGLNEVVLSLKKSLERIELEREKLLSINFVKELKTGYEYLVKSRKKVYLL